MDREHEGVGMYGFLLLESRKPPWPRDEDIAAELLIDETVAHQLA